jgi:hypothetical protein
VKRPVAQLTKRRVSSAALLDLEENLSSSSIDPPGGSEAGVVLVAPWVGGQCRQTPRSRSSM